MVEKKFSADIEKALEPFDGVLLNQLNMIYKSSPQFLFQIFVNKPDASLFEMTRFALEFEKLFQ
jgi:hypothetical protein